MSKKKKKVKNKVNCSYADLGMTSTGFMPTNGMTWEHQRGITQQLMEGMQRLTAKHLGRARGTPQKRKRKECRIQRGQDTMRTWPTKPTKEGF